MKPRMLVIAALLVALLLTGCAKKVQQYSIEQFMNTVNVFGGSFSHDESRLLVSTDETGVFNAYVIDVETGKKTQVTFSEDDAVYALSFLPEDERFLYMSDRGGNEIYNLYVKNENGTEQNLTPGDTIRSVFYGWSRDEKSFFYGSNRRDKRFMDVYEMDIETYAGKMIYMNDAGYQFGDISNDKNFMVFTKPITTNNNDMFLYNRETGEVTNITPHEGDVRYSPMFFGLDSRTLYFVTDEEREFNYLRLYDIGTGKVATIEMADWDISYSFQSWNGKYRVAAINNDARTEIKVYDSATEQELKLPKMPDGVITSVGISKSERYMRFYVNGSRAPNNLYVYDFETGSYKKLTDSMNPEIDQEDLIDASIIRYKSFDGLMIPAVYYRPKYVEAGEGIPALVWVHGGPGGQARVGYRATIQYLVNHGYAVIAVNNRGSSGYGKTFYKLDDRRHGEDDLRDCIEAKKFLAATGYIDEGKIGILGGSYGGYMVLAALTLAPEEFAVGVDLFGISNWLRTLTSIPPWWESFKEALYAEMGDPATDEARLRRISPLFNADKITRPLMVLQGANDPRVVKAESDDIVEAARENGVPVEYIVFEDEGHGFAKKENRIKGYGAILTFLDTYLKEAGADE